MVGNGSGFHFQLPGKSKQRILHPAKVVGLQDDTYTAEVEEGSLAVECGQDVLIYFEKSREFMQQSARIESVEESQERQMITLTTTGQPVSAESRQCYRVSTVMMELTADLGPEPGCWVLDVSSTGFSVIAAESYSIGNVVDVSIEYGDQSHSGKVSIQSIRELSPGRIRYGLHCTEAMALPGSLAQGLQQMSVQIQRAQLRRMAGAV